jgi:hypothetical protein
MIVVKMITDDNSMPYTNDYWHYGQKWGDAPRILCDGHVYGFGESEAQFEEKKGKITCPSCIAIIKRVKAIKL